MQNNCRKRLDFCDTLTVKYRAQYAVQTAVCGVQVNIKLYKLPS